MAVVLGDLQMVRELITHGALPNTASEVWNFGVFLCVVKSVSLFWALRIKPTVSFSCGLVAQSALPCCAFSWSAQLAEAVVLTEQSVYGCEAIYELALSTIS